MCLSVWLCVGGCWSSIYVAMKAKLYIYGLRESMREPFCNCASMSLCILSNDIRRESFSSRSFAFITLFLSLYYHNFLLPILPRSEWENYWVLYWTGRSTRQSTLLPLKIDYTFLSSINISLCIFASS